MKIAKIALFVLGGLAVLTGLIWIGQGTGYFPYPKSSFMISQMPWAYRGIGLGMLGVACILAGRKL